MYFEELREGVTPEIVERLRSGSSDGIAIFGATDLSPLEAVADHVLGLSVEGVRRMDWGSIRFLKNLRYFHAAESHLDGLSFAPFGRLVALDIDCRRAYIPADIDRCRRLMFLHATKPGWTDLRSLEGLTKLSTLCIDGGSLQRIGVERLNRSLRSLHLHNLKNLQDFDGVQRFSGLRGLVVSGCPRVSGFGMLAHLKHLRELSVAGATLESLEFVKQCRELEFLWMSSKAEVQDGDMAPLTTHRTLRRVSFIPRGHYSHRLKEVAECIAESRGIPVEAVSEMHDGVREHFEIKPLDSLEALG